MTAVGARARGGRGGGGWGRLGRRGRGIGVGKTGGSVLRAAPASGEDQAREREQQQHRPHATTSVALVLGLPWILNIA